MHMVLAGGSIQLAPAGHIRISCSSNTLNDAAKYTPKEKASFRSALFAVLFTMSQ